MKDERLQKKILRELTRIAFADCTEAVGMTADGTLRIRDTEEMPAALRSSIAGIKAGAKGVEVKFYDKLRALETLYKLIGEETVSADENITVTLRVME